MIEKESRAQGKGKPHSVESTWRCLVFIFVFIFNFVLKDDEVSF